MVDAPLGPIVPDLPRGPVHVADDAIVGDQCLLGCVKGARLRGSDDQLGGGADAPTVVGERCLIFNQVIVYEGVWIGGDCVVEDRVRIGYDTRVGARARLAYGAYVCDRVTIGEQARVAGFVCDGASIGSRSTVMGQLVHEYTSPHVDWWAVDEAPPAIGDDTVVGYGAVVIGGVRVGPRSYVAAGAVVTRDVPTGHVATGVNTLTPAARWQGTRLRSLLEYWSG